MTQDTIQKVISKDKMSPFKLYSTFINVNIKDWKVDVISDSSFRTENGGHYQILGIRNHIPGPSLLIMGGIHGEEPAGPNMLAQNLEYITKELSEVPTIILPLCNPLGYSKNQRYLESSESNKEGLSVGDADHLLLDSTLQNPRRNTPSSIECDKITRYLLERNKITPICCSLDFHEDDGLSKGYIYSQGKYGIKDKYAQAMVKELEKIVGIETQGMTRFNEPIVNGILGPGQDGSIDEFLSAKKIFSEGKIVNGINAETVLTIETPASNISLDKRIEAQRNAAYKAIQIFNNEYSNLIFLS